MGCRSDLLQRRDKGCELGIGRGRDLSAAGLKRLKLPEIASDGGAELLDPVVLGVGLGVAILSSAVPYSLEFEALRRLPAGVFGVLMSMEPAMAALAGFVRPVSRRSADTPT